MIDSDKAVQECFINISLPERTVDFIIFMTPNGLVFNEIYELTGIDVIPAIASEVHGEYELYYTKNNPEVGIQVLEQGLELTPIPSAIAEDLGYILRDEKRYKESIDAFLISEKHGTSSVYIFKEIRDLYFQINNKVKTDEYSKKIKNIAKLG